MSLVHVKWNFQAPPRNKVLILGDGNPKAVFVRQKDVASFTINTVDDPRTLTKAVYLRPTGSVCSMNELVVMWETKIGKKLERVCMSEDHILDKIRGKMEMGFMQGGYSIAAAAGLGLLMVVLLWRSLLQRRKTSNLPPAVPGLPLLGNLHQLKAKKPHQTFAKWGETYGPIYSIRTGASSLVVLNSTELAKEAMVTKFSSISKRKLSNALKILTANKSMVAMSDYDDFHRMVKRCILTSILGPNAQRRRRHLRVAILDNVLNHLYTFVKIAPNQAIKFRETFQDQLFSLAMKQAIGFDVESIYVDDFGARISREEIYNILVLDPMMGAIEVDWRDFFPYLRWIPNKKFEVKIDNMAKRRAAVTKALIAERKKQVEQSDGCYLDFLLSEAKMLTEDELTMLVWEAIIETSDTTVVTTEWALFELAKFPAYQERLYKEICEVCGSEKLTEDHLPRLPYLSAVFHETLRKHSPVPIIPLRYVHEDTQLGGYHIPAGTEIAVNIYGCNMDKKEWDNPEEWNPGRFMDQGNETTDLHRTMAFGGGKRTCAGALQAMLIACSTIGRLVQEFSWRLKEGEEENEVTIQLTNYKLHPMQAILTPRNEVF